MGFLQICSGVILLQLSKSAKDVPDAAVFKGDLDQVRTVAEQEEPESEPKADAIRGTAAIIRRFSNSRQMKEAAEAKRIHEERLKDQMEPIGEGELVEWDGVRRRKTVRSDVGPGLERRKTPHPPLGLTRFPQDEEAPGFPPGSNAGEDHDDFNGGVMNSFRRRALSTFSRGPSRIGSGGSSRVGQPTPSMAMTDVTLPAYESEANSGQGPYTQQTDGASERSHVLGLPQGLQRLGGDGAMEPPHLSPDPSHRGGLHWSGEFEAGGSRPKSRLGPSPPPHMAKRQFSFQNIFHRRKSDSRSDSRQGMRPISRPGLCSRPGTRDLMRPDISKSGTEEERLGLVKGDSNAMLPLPDYTSEDENWHLGQREADGDGHADDDEEGLANEKDIEQEIERQKWIDSGISPDRYHMPPPFRKREREHQSHDEGEGNDDTRSIPDSRENKGPPAGGGGAFI